MLVYLRLAAVWDEPVAAVWNTVETLGGEMSD
jgi:hypothetical protein